MKSDNLWDSQQRERIFRRQFLGRIGAGCLSLLSGTWRVAADENLPAPRFLLKWGQHGKGKGEFDACVGIAIGKNDEVYTCEFRNQRMQKFTPDGKFVGKWGEHGKEPGQFGGDMAAGSRFAGPQFVAFDRAGNVYATDAALNRVQKFTPDGKLLGVWGSPGSEPGGFGPPPLD